MALIASESDIDEEIRQHKFDNAAMLLRKNKLSETSRNLVADYLLGKLPRPKGRPKNDEYFIALSLYQDFIHLRKYGKTCEDCTRYIHEHYSGDNKNVLAALESSGLSRKCAIDTLADLNGMGDKNIERLVDMGKKLDTWESENFAEP